MAVAVGLRRIWVVVAVVYVIITSCVAISQLYWLREKESELVTASQEGPAPDTTRFGYRTPAEELKALRKEIAILQIACPLGILVPQIALYLAGAAIFWVVAGFRTPPRPKSLENSPQLPKD